ncbi:NirD/YgiW/YdeI family stress tolerance protein [Granulosicoccaceae sp. 1_MG-2023]|nr:NirD/YgiW/YdeI family stress tolerance protein [Granulosicoccaceae sp. 1_MG-2023]
MRILLPKLLAGSLIAALAMPLCAARAEYTGPSDTRLYTSVADVLQSPVDDAPVALTGRLIRRIDSENFVFADATAEIDVEIESDVMPEEDFDETRLLRLQGEVETRFMRDPEIEAERITLLPQEG